MLLEKKDFFLGTKFILLTFLKILIATNLIKNIIFGPAIHLVWERVNFPVFLNFSHKEKAIKEFSNYKRKFVFDLFCESSNTKKKLSQSISPNYLTKEKNVDLKKKVYKNLLFKTRKLINKYYQETIFTIINIFGDFLLILLLTIIIFKNSYQFKLFLKNLKFKFFELTDDNKAFLLILFSDTFVGFHSSYGWEILLENILKHFGLPQERSFIFSFVATLPVLLDTLFKYWIFKHLNGISPSIVSTYHKMNE
uniref:Envelope membrane protein n=1 Tax=Synura uvella TaxID=52557 RepID=A0A3G2QZJ4_9STRA|nr:envelope membrane protein [Synura uvella]AYO28402.1 envelope membrane protein [Synura uvella]